MNHEKPAEPDWKAFRKIVPELRERYLGKVNSELMALLQNPKHSPTEQFWDVEERIEREVKVLRTCLDGHSRSKMRIFLALMYQHRMLLDDDLDQFSEELRDRIKQLGAI